MGRNANNRYTGQGPESPAQQTLAQFAVNGCFPSIVPFFCVAADVRNAGQSPTPLVVFLHPQHV